MRQKYNEFTSIIQPTRSISPQQRKANLLKEMMQDFNVTDIEASLMSLVLAAEQVENMNTDHPPGYHARGSGNNPQTASLLSTTTLPTTLNGI